MPLIKLTTLIKASPDTVFDLSRSIEVHMESTSFTKERAIAGRTSGLCEAGDVVTWEAIHLGLKQRLTVRITKMNRPFDFEDEMVEGAFRSMRHRHIFKASGDGTTMTDEFEYQSPFGILGKIADRIFLEKYMTKLLVNRNRVIKQIAENPHS